MKFRFVLVGLLFVFLVGAATTYVGHHASIVRAREVARPRKSGSPTRPVTGADLSDQPEGAPLAIFGRLEPGVWESTVRRRRQFEFDADGTRIRVVNWGYLPGLNTMTKWPEPTPVSVVVHGYLTARPEGGPITMRATGVTLGDRDSYLTHRAKPLFESPPIPTFANHLGKRVRSFGIFMMALVAVATLGVLFQRKRTQPIEATA